jgi:hypothetical protein
MTALPLAVAAALIPRIIAAFTSHTVQTDRAMAFSIAALCTAVALRHTISMMVNGCGYLRRTAYGFPVAVAFAAVAFIPGASLPGPFAIPLWVACAELIVIGVLLTDASRILRRASGRP